MKYQSLTLILLLTLFSSVHPQTSPANSAKELFESGITLLQTRQYKEALAAFRQSARLAPERAETHGNIGTVLLALSQPQQAIAPIKEAIRLAPREGVHRTNLCSALSMIGRHAEAVEECEEGVRLSPDSTRASIALLTALKAAGRSPTDILRLADLALGRFQDNESLLKFAAELYFDAGNYAGSASLLQRLTGLRPDVATYHGFLAEVCLRLERDAEALTHARTALKLDPANPYGYYAMGMIFRELGQHEEAAESFGKVRSEDPRLRFAEFYKALSDAGRGRQADAISELEPLAKRFPNEYTIQLQFGSLLNQESRFEEAVAPLTKARQLEPKTFEAVAGLGLALFESGQLERAIPVLEDAQRLFPGNEVVTMFLNVTRARQTLFAEIDDMKAYARENPQDVDVRRRLVQAFAFSRRIAEADPYVNEIYAIRPKDLKLYAYVGVAYATAGKWEKAKEVHLKSLEIGESASAYRGLATIYEHYGNFEQASAAYAKLFELQPNSPDSMVSLARLLMNNGKRREALAMFKRSLSLKPTNGGAIFNAGVLSAKLGERDSALQYLEMLRPIRPDLAKTLDRALRLRIWG